MIGYAIGNQAVPLFKKPEIAKIFGGADSGKLQTDKIGLVRELEMVALPGSAFTIYEQTDDFIVRVGSDAYPVSNCRSLYTDKRFLEFSQSIPKKTFKALPTRDKVLTRLYDALGSRYVWGGNYKAGLPQMLEYYPPPPDADIDYWMLKGVDCSGLLYEATDGFTARNTAALMNCGEVVEIEGLNFKEIVNIAEPCDFVVWKGHIVIFIDDGKIIQSRHNPFGRNNDYPDGVYIDDALTVLEHFCSKKKAVNVCSGDNLSDEYVMRKIY